MEFKFVNEPEYDFSQPEHKEAMEKAFAKVQSEKGKDYPLVINGERIFTDKKIVSVNPAKKDEVIGNASSGTVEHAEQAMQAALEAYKTWQYTTVETRVELLQNLIKVMNEERYELAAWMVEESGKNWAEADGEICEAIDFFNGYCEGAINLDKGIELVPTDEKTKTFYTPIGVGVAIPPWNFPLSLMAGMVSGALATGNTIVMKPASDTPVVAYKFMELIEKAGYPKGVVNLVTGSGGVLGDYLVQHPKTRFINFTGSKEVGLRINRLAAEVSEGQIWVKRVVAEMGGKNAIIVDDSANVKKAALGVATSAFHFQGQKCSACSRAIVHADVYDEFVEALIEETNKLTPGAGRDNAIVGPVISQKAYNGIVDYIEIGRKEGKVVCGGTYDDSKGFFIDPTVIVDIKHGDRISVEEIFGPVVAVIKVNSYQEAIDVANGTEYGLTGAVYSQNREHIEQAVREFNVGNLYINRKSTGAVVHQHPFGGYNMSGTAAKTGITDYLHNFVYLKSVAENVKDI